MTAPTTRRPLGPQLDSPRTGTARRTLGAHMQHNQILDLVERLLRAAEHPDIADVVRYGPGLGPWGPSVEQSRVKQISGVKVIHQSTATASLWEAVWPGEKPVPVPAMPAPSRRTTRLLILATQLLDVARPEQLRSWQLVALPDLGLDAERGVTPTGLSYVTSGGVAGLLRATATGPTTGHEPVEEPFPDYTIPEGVKTCLSVNAASAIRG